MKYLEIAHLEQKELWKRFGQLKKELFQSKMQLKMQRLSNPLSIRFLRRDIARIQTALSQAKDKKPSQTKVDENKSLQVNNKVIKKGVKK